MDGRVARRPLLLHGGRRDWFVIVFIVGGTQVTSKGRLLQERGQLLGNGLVSFAATGRDGSILVALCLVCVLAE